MKIVITYLLCWIAWPLAAQKIPGHTKGLVGAPVVVSADTVKGPFRLVCFYKPSNPLVLIDSVAVPCENADCIAPSSIRRIKVIKGAEALRLYGERGRHGVIIITSKKRTRTM